MKILKGLLAVTLVGNMATQGFAADADVEARIIEDSAQISQWMSDQFRYAVPFNANAGNAVPSQISFPGFDVGISGIVSATKFDTGALNNLPTSVVDPNQIDRFSRFPFPSALIHAKAGLPLGFDVGIRIGGIPKTTIDKEDSQIKIKNKIFGFDVRKSIIGEGVTTPVALTVGLSYTHVDGSIDSATSYSAEAGASVNGKTVSFTDTAGIGRTAWKSDSIGLQALASKTFLFITPSLGLAVNRNNGTVDSSINTRGTAVVNGLGQSLDVTGSGRAEVRKWDTRLLAGLEFSFLPFMRLGLNAEFGGSKNIAGGVGLRVEFP